MMQKDADNTKIRRKIQVRGVVQGVGFRPFVSTLAVSMGLTGFVFNSSAGVTIEVEGAGGIVGEFVRRVEAEAPPLAEISELTVDAAMVAGDDAFVILKSREVVGEFALVPADAGSCEACWRDFSDATNRRFGYAFTNCTHCGPRYTIIEDIPYDRAKTTMSGFVMCAECAAEYSDPGDRRFHAQPNACAVCGPALCLVASGAIEAECSFAASGSLPAIQRTRELLRAGKIVAVKGLGGFLLACDASNEAAVTELRRRKRRPAKPFAVMVRDLQSLRRICEVSEADEAVLAHPRRPIVILPRLRGEDLAKDAVAASVAPGSDSLGVMLPYTPLHFLLFGKSAAEAAEFDALVMTSGNRSEEPIVISNGEALSQLAGIADWFLLHNREIATRADDSVVRVFEGKERVLRRSRGFVPQSIRMGTEMQHMLAVGADLKNTFCLTRGREAILSQHIGDMENYETELFFMETLEKMKRLFKVQPKVVAHDLHPGYRSTRMALSIGVERRFGVQHHHAHIASCMAENHLTGKVIGVAMDGTGYGPDGTIWGGEFLVADFAGFERFAHLRAVPMPGGDAAVRQPWRMAMSYLRDAFGAGMPAGLACFEMVPETQVRVVETMLARGVQTVRTSSCGRLFDAVAAMTGMGGTVTFEGQAAMALEMAADANAVGRYRFDLVDGAPLVVDLRETIREIVRDTAGGRGAGEISAKFHHTLCAAVTEVCCRMRKETGLARVCLSGGVFQNHMLLGLTVRELRRSGFGVFLQAMVPVNDGGISLGQAIIANELLRQGDCYVLGDTGQGGRDV